MSDERGGGYWDRPPGWKVDDATSTRGGEPSPIDEIIGGEGPIEYRSRSGRTDDDDPDSVTFESRRQPRRRSSSALTAVMLLLTVAFLAGTGVLAYQAYETSRDVVGGTSDDTSPDPNAPGYEALVEPTPNLAVAVPTAEGSLATTLLFTQTSSEGGGAAVVVPAFTMTGDGGVETVFNSIFVNDGVEAYKDVLEESLSFQVDSLIVLDEAAAGSLFDTGAPLVFKNPDELVSTQADGSTTVAFPAGEVQLDAAQVIDYLAFSMPGENPINQAVRGETLIRAWIQALATSGAPVLADDVAADVTGADADAGDLQEFLANLVGGTVVVSTSPIKAVPLADPQITLYFVDDGQARNDWVSQVMPFPALAFPGQRARVKVLRAPGTSPDIATAASSVVAAGGAVTLLGNTDEATVAATTVEYSDESFKEVADAIAQQFGITATTTTEAVDSADITLTLAGELDG